MFIQNRFFRNIILDMDGVIYRGKRVLPGSRECIDFIRRQGCRLVFMSNNSALTRKQYVARLSEMGIEAVEGEIVHSSLITAYSLKKEHPGASLYAIGEDGLIGALQEADLTLVADPLADGPVDYVVVGMDRQFSYQKMKTAMKAILGGAEFLGTNPDLTYPDETGLSPGAGAILTAIEACSGVKPRVFGKPARQAIELLLEMTGFSRKETILVGDRMDTDIKMAREAGIYSVLVLSGVTLVAPTETSGLNPDLVVENLAELLRRLGSQEKPIERRDT